MGIFSSNAASKQQKKASKKKPRGKPFAKDKDGKHDPRINLKGRPRTSDALKTMILDILAEEGENRETHEKITVLRGMLLKMALDGTPADRMEILNRGFGKVKDEIVFSTDDIKKIIDYLPPDYVDRLARGEDLGDVIISLITSHRDGKTKAA